MAERIRLVTTEMFRARPEDRSASTNRQITYFMRDVIGQGRLRFCREIKAGRAVGTFEALGSELNNYILGESLPRIYALSGSVDPQEFYLQQQRHAIGVIEYYGEILPELPLELKDEISLLSERPSDLVKLLFRSPASIDSVLAYQAHRHVLLSHLSGLIHARAKNGRLRTVLSDVHDLLNNQLFEGVEGTGTRMVVESIHDDETGEVIGLSSSLRRAPLTAHQKRLSFNVRRVREVGPVYTSTRKKDDRIAIIKALAKAQSNGGVVDINNDIQDSIGMRFVPMDGAVMPEQLADLVVLVIQSGAGKLPTVERIEDKQVGADHGQSPEYRHTGRRVWFDGVPVPVDFIFQSYKDYLNSILDVGARDPQTGLYMGRAHELFVLRRARMAAPILFDPKVYPLDFDTAFVKSSKLRAEELRLRYKAA